MTPSENATYTAAQLWCRVKHSPEEMDVESAELIACAMDEFYRMGVEDSAKVMLNGARGEPWEHEDAAFAIRALLEGTK